MSACVYCGDSVDSPTQHYAEANNQHPEFVVIQARADLRAAAGGPYNETERYSVQYATGPSGIAIREYVASDEIQGCPRDHLSRGEDWREYHKIKPAVTKAIG